MKEIESKAWVTPNDKERILYFLHHSKNITIRNNNKPIQKKDTMYKKISSNTVAFRLREESNTYWITKKTRTYTPSKTEINSEIEFQVTDKKEFNAFIKTLGYTEMYTKEKTVYQYEYRMNNTETMLIEYVSIPELSHKGDLLEIEILCNDNASVSHIKKAEQSIVQLLQKLQLEQNIEPLPYGKLLKQF